MPGWKLCTTGGCRRSPALGGGSERRLHSVRVKLATTACAVQAAAWLARHHAAWVAVLHITWQHVPFFLLPCLSPAGRAFHPAAPLLAPGASCPGWTPVLYLCICFCQVQVWSLLCLLNICRQVLQSSRLAAAAAAADRRCSSRTLFRISAYLPQADRLARQQLAAGEERRTRFVRNDPFPRRFIPAAHRLQGAGRAGCVLPPPPLTRGCLPPRRRSRCCHSMSGPAHRASRAGQRQ